MGKFYVTDGTYLIASGTCPDGLEKMQGASGVQSLPGEAPAHLKPRPAPDQSYDKMRAQSYPTIGAQLDWLWHAMNNGTLPIVEPFYSEIKAVKDRFPKPSN